MKYQKTITLKDGRECLLRGATGADGEAVLNFFNLTHAQTDYLLSYPGEIGFTLSQEQDFLAAKDASPNAIEICAFVDGVLAGTAGIDPIGAKYKVKHRCEFGITVEQTFWGLGIGRALTVACIDCAKQAGFSQIELDAVAENDRALSLYKSAGFREYGRNPRGFRSRTGHWQELVLMRLELNP